MKNLEDEKLYENENDESDLSQEIEVEKSFVHHYREYKYRYVIAILYCLVNIFNGMTWGPLL